MCLGHPSLTPYVERHVKRCVVKTTWLCCPTWWPLATYDHWWFKIPSLVSLATFQVPSGWMPRHWTGQLCTMPPTAEVLQDSAAAWASEGRGVPTGLPSASRAASFLFQRPVLHRLYPTHVILHQGRDASSGSSHSAHLHGKPLRV